MNTKRLCAVLVLSLFCLVGTGCTVPTPTATFKAFYDAFRKTDIPTMKANVSQGSIALGEQMAKFREQTLDEWIKAHPGTDYEPNPDVRNERIDGDTATLEVKATKVDKWSTVMFVREGGRWKIAFDKMFDQIKSSGKPQPPA